MIGCIFRLIKIEQMSINKSVVVIHLQLCDDGEHDLKKLFDHIKNDYGRGNEEVNTLEFGEVLHQMIRCLIVCITHLAHSRLIKLIVIQVLIGLKSHW